LLSGTQSNGLSSAQALAAFGPASSENGTTTAGSHAGTEAMTASANQSAGLKSTFHDTIPFLNLGRLEEDE